MEITRRKSRRIAEKSAASRNDGVVAASFTHAPDCVLMEKSAASRNDGVVDASITHALDRVLMEKSRTTLPRIEGKSDYANRNDGVVASVTHVLNHAPMETKSRKIQGKSAASRNFGVFASFPHAPDSFLIEKCSITKSRRIEGKSDDASQNDGVVTTITDVPDHVLTEIFSGLSVKSVCRCKSVCKGWFHLLTSPNFIQLHFDKAPLSPIMCYKYVNFPDFLSSTSINFFEYGRDNFLNADGNLNFTVFKFPCRRFSRGAEISFLLVNSCNGLLCLRNTYNRCRVAIYNPVTGEYSILPIPENAGDVSVVGLGFSPSTNQYKVLLVLNVVYFGTNWDDRSSGNVALLYTLGMEGGGWRNVESPPCLKFLSTFEPVFLNGALHWLQQTDKPLTNTCGAREFELGIMSFDFEGEKFRNFSTPPGLKCRPWKDKILGIVRGHLYLCDRFISDCIGMWVMKDYGHEKSWTKEFVFDVNGGVRWSPFGLSPTTYFSNTWELLLYWPQRKSIYYLNVHQRAVTVRCIMYDETEDKFEVFFYVPSFLSIKTVVGDSLEVLNVRSV